MKRNLVRLFVALVISTGCFVGTVFWFRSGQSAGKAADRDPVARLNDSVNEVQRKPAKRVIWESINRNDELFPGETIRTAANSEAKLLFVKTGTVVHLEPESLVVLEETGEGLSLDFLQGNLYVKSAGDASGLTLRTGNGDIKLKSADMSLSKANNGQVNLEVLSGEAELLSGSQKMALGKDRGGVLSASGLTEAKDRLHVLHPKAGDTLLLNLSRGEKLDLEWQPLPVGYRIQVDLGANRTSMNPVAEAAQAGEAGKSALKSKPGRWFLRLTAIPSDSAQPTLTSMVIPFTIEPKTPPALARPSSDLPVLRKSTEEEVAFSRLNRHKFESQVLEVASDAKFKTGNISKSLSGDAIDLSMPLPDGNYFWRVTGFMKVKGQNEALASPAVKFAVTSKWELKAPTLLSPAHMQRLSFMDIQKSGVILRWQIPNGVNHFQVNVEQKNGTQWKQTVDKRIEAGLFPVTDLKPGMYRWYIGSVDSRSTAILNSDPFEFIIDDVPKLEWVNNAPVEEYEYTSATPSLMAQWKSLSVPTNNFRYKIAAEGESLEAAPWQSTRQTGLSLPLPADGRYQGLVEAMSDKGRTIAKSDMKTLVVKRRPLLPAPQWTAETPDVLKSDAKGNLSFGWLPVAGANSYIVILQSDQGDVVSEKSIERTTASLNRLRPGQYKVKLKSVDSYKRTSPDSDLRPIEVPSTSDIRAPRFKKMQVK